MAEIRCPKCGEVFQVDESGYAQIVKQVRDKEFEKELHSREADMESRRKNELEVLRLHEEKVHAENISQKDALLSEKDREIAELSIKKLTKNAPSVKAMFDNPDKQKEQSNEQQNHETVL